jgi:peptide-methionine (S)-S-oxide reductase
VRRLLLLAGLVVSLGPSGVRAELATATFAGGCFWCMEPAFEGLDGVVSTTVGYTGGHTKNPTYEDVSAGRTGHAESVQVVYDPARISYARLLDIFWHNVDPLTANAQFCDHGNQYRSAIFYHDDRQHHLAEASKERVQKTNHPIVTEIVAASAFYPLRTTLSVITTRIPSVTGSTSELRSRSASERTLGRRSLVRCAHPMSWLAVRGGVRLVIPMRSYPSRRRPLKISTWSLADGKSDR